MVVGVVCVVCFCLLVPLAMVFVACWLLFAGVVACCRCCCFGGMCCSLVLFAVGVGCCSCGLQTLWFVVCCCCFLVVDC